MRSFWSQRRQASILFPPRGAAAHQSHQSFLKALFRSAHDAEEITLTTILRPIAKHQTGSRRFFASPYAAKEVIHLSNLSNASPPLGQSKRLPAALAAMVTHPVQSIVPPWSWKAAVFTAVLRGLTFFATNLRSGERVALHAMLVESAYAVFAAGLAGAISQQLRKTEPLGATLAVVLLALPGFFVLGQLAVHKAAHTPHLAGGLLASFFLTSLSSGFSWYAMRNGAMLGGVDDTTVLHDLQALPRISIGFLLAVPRLLLRTYRGPDWKSE